MSNREFKRAYSALIRRSGARAEDVARKVMLGVLSMLIKKSPVDTGRFRGNWNVGVGGMDLSTGNTVDPDGSGALARGAQAISAGVLGKVFWMTNSLPYARRLEYGWSQQAPGGMVRLTVVEWASHLREVVAANPRS